MTNRPDALHPVSMSPAASCRRSPPVVLLVNLLLLLQFLVPVPANAWEPVFEAENLRVERREYQGSALQEIRGIIRLQASLNAVMALLKDADFNSHWVYRSGGAKILEENGYAQAYVHGIVDAPWPMQDRDTIVRFDYTQQADSGEITIAISNFPDFIPPGEPFVRVPDFGGHWRLRPQAGGWVEVTYQVYGDPGGLMPVWLANYAAATSVTRTLQNMPTAVQRYHDAASVFVNEPPQQKEQ